LITESALQPCKTGAIAEFEFNKELRAETPTLLLSIFPLQQIYYWRRFLKHYLLQILLTYALIASIVTKIHIFTAVPCILILSKSFIYQLMHN